MADAPRRADFLCGKVHYLSKESIMLSAKEAIDAGSEYRLNKEIKFRASMRRMEPILSGLIRSHAILGRRLLFLSADEPLGRFIYDSWPLSKDLLVRNGYEITITSMSAKIMILSWP